MTQLTPWERLRSSRARSTAPEALAPLADDEYWRVRRSVADNANAAPDVLAHLADDPDPDVRSAVAWNRSTPAPTLERLAADDHRSVRCGVARDLAVPETGDAGGNVMRRQKGAAPTPERVSSTRGGSR